jgi:hypothetical protein
MKISLSNKIRKLAALIERDNTPSEVVIGESQRIEGDSTEDNIPPKKGIKVQEEKMVPTAPPEQRRPRKQPNHKNKWNEDTKTSLMNDYMKNYRADGKDKEVDGPKSTYKKKLKV